ncbi:superoxide dismutase [Candidatus Carsonella ruddii]|uniref:superoxide dismutase n=1 Tax=Carsonella ruddii TaxID=114186 RepID=UPI003D9A3D44
MIKIFNINYKKNDFLSKEQFDVQKKFYLNSLNNLNFFLLSKKIFFKNKFELIDILSDLSEFDKNHFSNILGNYLNCDYYFKNISFNKNNCFGEIYKKIIETYNNYENFEFNFIKIFENFNGWGWIIYNNNRLCFVKTFENNNPLFSIDLGGYNSIPLLCIDLHEHSYYLDYFNNKKKYLKNFLKNINWYEIENRLQNLILNN